MSKERGTPPIEMGGLYIYIDPTPLRVEGKEVETIATSYGTTPKGPLSLAVHTLEQIDPYNIVTAVCEPYADGEVPVGKDESGFKTSRKKFIPRSREDLLAKPGPRLARMSHTHSRNTEPMVKYDREKRWPTYASNEPLPPVRLLRVVPFVSVLTEVDGFVGLDNNQPPFKDGPRVSNKQIRELPSGVYYGSYGTLPTFDLINQPK